MAIYRHVHIEFWKSPKVLEEFTPEDKLFFLYLMTNPNTTQIGIYKITTKQISFEMGYSKESINAIMDRFENKHKIIKYNKETREIAIKNWGKYNLNKGGKPMIDCIKKEVQQVRDKSLLDYVKDSIVKEDIKSLFEYEKEHKGEENYGNYKYEHTKVKSTRSFEKENEPMYKKPTKEQLEEARKWLK